MTRLIIWLALLPMALSTALGIALVLFYLLA